MSSYLRISTGTLGINFRMRAMLVSVAAYPLWLHWRPVGLWLARQFLDYEPGIHWPQMQMQSGTTGINVPRIYNPVKQARDHDPHGHFVRRWLPALRQVPDTWLFEPWRMPEAMQLRLGLRPASTCRCLRSISTPRPASPGSACSPCGRGRRSNRPRRRSSRNMGRASGMPCVVRQNPSICSN
jgi:hypothetical protein